MTFKKRQFRKKADGGKDESVKNADQESDNVTEELNVRKPISKKKQKELAPNAAKGSGTKSLLSFGDEVHNVLICLFPPI